MITRRTQHHRDRHDGIAALTLHSVAWVVLSDHPSNGYAMWVHGSMLVAAHFARCDDHAIVVNLFTSIKLEGISGRRVAHRTGAHIHRARCMVRPGPTPQPMDRVASEGSGGARTELRLGRVARRPTRATLTFLRFLICGLLRDCAIRMYHKCVNDSCNESIA